MKNHFKQAKYSRKPAENWKNKQQTKQLENDQTKQPGTWCLALRPTVALPPLAATVPLLAYRRMQKHGAKTNKGSQNLFKKNTMILYYIQKTQPNNHTILSGHLLVLFLREFLGFSNILSSTVGMTFLVERKHEAGQTGQKCRRFIIKMQSPS